ncbi:MAG: ParB/RepB/Spo0J family partition protein, partial [Clostridia bacterium]|nr:ParB/RepB/Spo0J family partition protein [Clostridia bacterium]
MKRGLGRGLNSLFGEYDNETTEKEKEEVVKVEQVVVNEPKEIEIGLIDRNPEQPRKVFDDEALSELATSIKNYGVIQPIIVKEVNGRYVIIAGERRWRASRLAGLKTIPCVIKDYTEQEISEIAIIENLQREDLNPIESAKAIKSLINQFDLTQDEVADKIGKS